jgi:hypothetical protein
MKISNWNVERPQRGAKRTSLIKDKILSLNSEIIVLTETSEALELDDYYPYSVSTIPFDRTPEEQWITIWTKYPVIDTLPTIDSNRTICGKIALPAGELIIYGTIIPYHMAGVSGLRYGNLGYKAWEYHEKDLVNQSNDWEQIIKQNSSTPFFIIGDFNQTRNRLPGYGTDKVRSLLTDILEKLKQSCVTAIDFSKDYLHPDPKTGKIRNNIDHICVSEALLDKLSNYSVGAWDHFDENHFHLSDHNGVYIEMKW